MPSSCPRLSENPPRSHLLLVMPFICCSLLSFRKGGGGESHSRWPPSPPPPPMARFQSGQSVTLSAPPEERAPKGSVCLHRRTLFSSRVLCQATWLNLGAFILFTPTILGSIKNQKVPIWRQAKEHFLFVWLLVGDVQSSCSTLTVS